MPNVFWAAFGGGAVAGIVTLLALAFVEWLRWFIDRPLVKPRLWFVQKLHISTKDDTRYLGFEAVNPHTKTVTLSTFGLLYKEVKKGRLQVLPMEAGVFPYRLPGGESISQSIPQDNLFSTLRKTNNRPKDLKWVYFSASSGKIFRSKIASITLKELERRFVESQSS